MALGLCRPILDLLELFGINSTDRTAWLLPSVLDFNTFNAQVFIISLFDSRKIIYIFDYWLIKS